MTCDDKQKQHNDIHSFFFEERNAGTNNASAHRERIRQRKRIEREKPENAPE